MEFNRARGENSKLYNTDSCPDQGKEPGEDIPREFIRGKGENSKLYKTRHLHIVPRPLPRPADRQGE